MTLDGSRTQRLNSEITMCCDSPQVYQSRADLRILVRPA